MVFNVPFMASQTSFVRAFDGDRVTHHVIDAVAEPAPKQPDPEATAEKLDELVAEWQKLETARLSHSPARDHLRLDLLPGLIRKVADKLGVPMPELRVPEEIKKQLGPVRFHDPSCGLLHQPPGGWPAGKSPW